MTMPDKGRLSTRIFERRLTNAREPPSCVSPVVCDAALRFRSARGRPCSTRNCRSDGETAVAIDFPGDLLEGILHLGPRCVHDGEQVLCKQPIAPARVVACGLPRAGRVEDKRVAGGADPSQSPVPERIRQCYASDCRKVLRGSQPIRSQDDRVSGPTNSGGQLMKEVYDGYSTREENQRSEGIYRQYQLQARKDPAREYQGRV